MITDPAANVVPERVRIAVDGERKTRAVWRTILFHKPRGVVTTRRDPKGRPTIYDVIGVPARGLVAVGRLDLATSGLLLLTSDTRLANWIADPENAVPRVYAVTVRGRVSSDDVARLDAPMVHVRKASGRKRFPDPHPRYHRQDAADDRRRQSGHPVAGRSMDRTQWARAARSPARAAATRCTCTRWMRAACARWSRPAAAPTPDGAPMAASVLYVNGQTLMSVAVTPGPSLDLGVPRPLFTRKDWPAGRAAPTPNGFDYDVTPDGQRILLNVVDYSLPQAPITVIVDWPALLKN